MCTFMWAPRSTKQVIGYPIDEEKATFEEETVCMSIANLRMIHKQKMAIWKDLQRTIRINNGNHRAIRGLAVMILYDAATRAQATRGHASSEPLREVFTAVLLALLILLAAMLIPQMCQKFQRRAIDSRQDATFAEVKFL